MSPDVIEAIARVCHEANRAYCLALGDASQVPWDQAPEWQRSSARAGVMLHLEDPAASPAASHKAWMALKKAEGWTYGPKKDPDAKMHPCMVPFIELPVAQQAKDFIFKGIVNGMHTAFLDIGLKEIARQELDNA